MAEIKFPYMPLQFIHFLSAFYFNSIQFHL